MIKINKQMLSSAVVVLLVLGFLAYFVTVYVQQDKERRLSLSSAATSREIFPYADGFYKGWLLYPSLPDSPVEYFQAIDEDRCNGTRDYVSSKILGKKQSFKLNLSSIPDGATINSITIAPCASTILPDADKSATLSVFYRLNGVDSGLKDYSVSSTTTDLYKEIPNPLQPKVFNLNKVKNSNTSLEIGVQYRYGNAGVQVSRLGATISYTPPAVAGSLSIALDSSSPALKLVQAGSIDQTLSVLRLNASGEDIRLDKIGLKLSKTNFNTPLDLTKVTLWDGSKKVGEVLSQSEGRSTVKITGMTIPKDGQKLLIIKGNIANIGSGFPGVSGHLVSVDYDGAAGVVGTGLSSGASINTFGQDSESNGVRLVKAVPIFTKLNASGVSSDKNNKILYRFKIFSPGGTNGISLFRTTFDFSFLTPGGKINNLAIHCFSDENFTTPSCGSVGDGSLVTRAPFNIDPSGPFILPFFFYSKVVDSAKAIEIPPGVTRYFELRGDISQSLGGVVIKMLGDASWQSKLCDVAAKSQVPTMCVEPGTVGVSSTFENTVIGVASGFGSNSDFIWSDNPKNITTGSSDYVWINGFLVPGLPTVQTASEVVL